MMMLQTVSSLVIWMVLVPCTAGIVPAVLLREKKISLTTVFVAGWCFMLAVFQLCAVPAVLLKKSLSDLEVVYTLLMGILSVTGITIASVGLLRKSLNEWMDFNLWKTNSKEDWITWGLFAVLLLGQLIMSVVYMTPDGDDAYYVTHAVMADELDSMYLKNPYTGADGALDARHVLAPFSMFIAFLARKSMVHATVIAHTGLPLALIPLTYCVFYRIGTAFWEKERGKISIFMVLISLAQLFGASSIYTNETFFLTRTWQGKSLLANVALPMAFYILFMICKRTEKGRKNQTIHVGGWYILLTMVNLLGALASSLGLLLLVILESGFFLLISIRNRRPWVLFVGILSMIPCFFFMLLYVLL